MRTLVIIVVLCVTTGAAIAAPGDEGAGPSGVVDAIEYRGNHRTKTKVLAREMLLQVGDPYSEEQFQASLQRIRNLGLYYRVTGEVVPVPGTDRLHLTVRVKEKWSILPLPELDISDEGNVKAGINYTDYNFRGEDQLLQVKVKHAFGTDSDTERGDSASVNLDFRELRDSPYDFSVGLGWATDGEAAASTELTTTGEGEATSVDLDLELHHFTREGTSRRRMGGGVTINYVTETDGAGTEDTQWVNSVRFTHSLDSVDDFNYTFAGHRWDYTVELFTLALGSNADALKLDLGYQWYWKFGQQNVTARAQTGYTIGPDASEVGFELGGGRSVRGIEKDSISGKGMWLGNLEYRSPRAWNWLGGAAFLDAGTAGQASDLLDPGRVAAGGGLGLRVYIGRLVQGVVRLDTAYGYHPDDGFSTKLYFSLKQPF
ncbi:MAG TPA: POTRA domain-containing protein [bacterium]